MIISDNIGQYQRYIDMDILTNPSYKSIYRYQYILTNPRYDRDIVNAVLKYTLAKRVVGSILMQFALQSGLEAYSILPSEAYCIACTIMPV